MPQAARDDAGSPRERLRVFRAMVAVVGLIAFAAFVLLRIVPAIDAAHQRLRHALKNARESEDAALARFRTPEYVAALRRVRETIPENAAYYLVPAEAWHRGYFVRFDLAPRRLRTPSGPRWSAPP